MNLPCPSRLRVPAFVGVDVGGDTDANTGTDKKEEENRKSERATDE
jgi:hypothetical protein